MSPHLGLQHCQMLGGVVGCSGGQKSKGVLEFPFDSNLGLRLEAGTKLNNEYEYHND